MNDNIVKAFYSYLNESGFTYTSSAESELNSLKKTLDEKKYSDKAKNYIAELGNELKSESLNDFENSKPVIKSQLEMEILRKYNKPDNEVLNAGLKNDVQLQTALSIIKDRAVYNGYLNVR